VAANQPAAGARYGERAGDSSVAARQTAMTLINEFAHWLYQNELHFTEQDYFLVAMIRTCFVIRSLTDIPCLFDCCQLKQARSAAFTATEATLLAPA
jgi:hypothetical protein